LKATLIIPSVHSRAALLDRALSHLEAQQFRGEVIVSDHSPAGQTSVLREVLARHRALRVLALEHDPAWHFLQRLTDCAEAAQSDYVAVHADDDFMFVDALDECAGFLEHHADFAAAKGRMLFFSLQPDKPPALGQHEGYPRTEDDVAQRVLRHVANFNATLYAVHRRAQFIESHGAALARTANVIFWQYLASCLTLVQGKLHVAEAPYYFRQDNPTGWRSTLVRERAREHWPMLILAPEFPALLGAFAAGLREALAAAHVRIDAALERQLDDAYLWLIRRALCGVVKNESAEQDKAFLQRVASAGTPENLLLTACIERCR
jgi:glycosyltransferase domain-containing protein